MRMPIALRTALSSALSWGLVLVLAGAFSVAGATSIQTVTFTGIPPDGPDPVSVWIEDGITATGAIRYHGVPDAVHLDGPGTTNFGSFVDFTTGGLFEPLSTDVLPMGSGYCSEGTFPDGCGGFSDDPIDYIWFTGFLDDAVVTSFGLYLPAGDAFETIPLSELGTIDRLRVQMKTFFEQGLPGSCEVGQGCGHFSFTNVSLRAAGPAIPEPTAALFFAAGLLCVALRRSAARRP